MAVLTPKSGIKKLSLIEYFSSKQLQEGASLSANDKLLIKYCMVTGVKTDNGQPQKLCIYVAFIQVSKLGLHPEMFPSLAHIIKLLTITIKMKTGLLMYVYFLWYVYLYVLCS